MCSASQGRAPVLLDNLAQAILMAPFFVIFEVSRHYDPNLTMCYGSQKDEVYIDSQEEISIHKHGIYMRGYRFLTLKHRVGRKVMNM